MVDDLHLPNGNRLGDLRLLVLDAKLICDLLRIVDPLGQPRFFLFGRRQLLLAGSQVVHRRDAALE